MGGLIGLERSGNNHAAGLRTHIIVCLGAASIMVVSECIVIKYGIQSEIMRMGAQVVSGVGFLGAGSIIADGNKIRGITTAAGLWTTAGVGIIVGAGYYIISITVVAFILFAMLALRPINSRIQSRTTKYRLSVELENKDMIQVIIDKLITDEIEIISVRFKEKFESNKINAVFELNFPQNNKKSFMHEMSNLDGLTEFIAM